MPLDENGVPKRKIDLDLFNQDGSRSSQTQAKQADINFLLERQERPKPAIIEENDGHLASQLRWAKLVADRKILKSDRRDKLKEHLDALLTGLNRRYITGQPTTFPSNAELVKLTEVIFALAKQLDVKKTGFGDLLGAVKRIENRFSKVFITGFVAQLRDRLCRFPLCPAAVVRKAASQQTSDKATLEAIAKFLMTGEVNGSNTSWENWFELIRELKFPTSALSVSDAKNLLQSAGDPQRRGQIARLLLMDLRRQQLEWDRRYGKSIRASLQWIYLLQRPEDYTLLKKVFCGKAPAPTVIAEKLAIIDNALRQKRHRKKRKRAKG